MIRRNFLKAFPALSVSGGIGLPKFSAAEPLSDREYWLKMLIKIVSPVLSSLSENALRKNMPVEEKSGLLESRKEVTHLEAFGRTLAGIAPWLELKGGLPEEEKLRKELLELSLRSIENAVNPKSPDFMNFNKGKQPLVDAAFFAHGLLLAPRQLWGNLSTETKSRTLSALRSTRIIEPYRSNWLLFSAIIEAALLKFSSDYDPAKINYAIKEHQSWYKGDGVYGDGPDFHFDYYNGFVIHPMLLDVTRTVNEATNQYTDEFPVFLRRAQRYAEIQERLISPEGTFPPVGRSLAYRCGAFQLLAQLSLQKSLPSNLVPAQVRSALTAVIRKTMEPSGTFDPSGWLKTGFAGHQPEVGEGYISTGSLYLCTAAFLPLGLPPDHEFWSAPSRDWTSKIAFAGKSFPIDKAMTDK